jgi:hypothetical protein
MTNTDVFAARYEPGFDLDLTSWKVTIGRDRRLRQEVSIYDPASPYHKQLLRFRGRLTSEHTRELGEIVDRIGFRGFDRAYTHRTMSVTDCPTYRIAVRFADHVKEVEAYNLRRLADFERRPAMVGFAELWEAITRHAPFGKVPLAEGLPRPWWRFW